MITGIEIYATKTVYAMSYWQLFSFVLNIWLDVTHRPDIIQVHHVCINLGILAL